MRATDVLRSALMGIVEEMGLNWPAKAVIEPPRDPKHGDLAANIAMLLAFPLLTAIFDAIGIIGGYLTGVLMLHINEGAYLYRIASSVTMNDVAGGFIKSLVFGLLVATVCCHQGYTTHMRRDSVGPEAVGNATTSAVVISCVLILVADYVLTSFLL